MEALSKRFVPLLLATLAFSLPVTIIMLTVRFAENVAINFVVGVVILFLVSLSAGFVSKEEITPYLVSTIVMLAVSTSSFFPNRSPLWSSWLGIPSLGLIFGVAVGLSASETRTYILNARGLRRFTLTKKSAAVSFLLVLLFVCSYAAYVNSETIVAYFDQHSWLVTIIGIFVSSIIAYFGRGYYEKRRRKN